jgi:hypothetical protein
VGVRRRKWAAPATMERIGESVGRGLWRRVDAGREEKIEEREGKNTMVEEGSADEERRLGGRMRMRR